MSTDVESELSIVNSATWATDLEESLNNSLGIIQEEKEEEAATWQDRWANRRRKFSRALQISFCYSCSN